MQQEPQQHPAYAPQPSPPTPELPKPEQSPQYGGQSYYQPAVASQYSDHQDDPVPDSPIAKNTASVDGAVSWEASEYIHNDKGAMWVVGLVAIVAVVAGISFWLQAWTFFVLVLVMGLAMGVVAFRKPHTMSYELTTAGIAINGRQMRFDEFRAFGVLKQDAFYMLTFIPVKRFAPAINVYFHGEDGEKIVDIIGSHLPMEVIKPDPIDTVMRKLHF